MRIPLLLKIGISNVEVDLQVKVEVDSKGKARLVIPYGCKHFRRPRVVKYHQILKKVGIAAETSSYSCLAFGFIL